MSYDKEHPPLDEPEREKNGTINKKTAFLIAGGVGAFAALLWAVAGITVEPEEKNEKGLAPSSLARPDMTMPPRTEERKETPSGQPAEATPLPEGKTKRERQKRRIEDSVLVFGNKHMSPITDGLLEGSGGTQMADASLTRDSTPRLSDAGNSRPSGGHSGNAVRTADGGSRKLDFYQGGGGRKNLGLYHPYTMQPELGGCVVKAGDEIIVQNANPVRTELPGRVRGMIIEPVYGKIFLGGGQFEECLAIPSGSTILSEINATGVSRGDVRVQMCATRIDMRGGGIMPLDCSPALGQDGASGAEAEADYPWAGIATGILIDTALGAASAVGGLIQGDIAGVAIQIGTRGIRSVGSDYVDRELIRPPVLTMNPGAIYKVQINSDISFSEE